MLNENNNNMNKQAGGEWMGGGGGEGVYQNISQTLQKYIKYMKYSPPPPLKFSFTLYLFPSVKAQVQTPAVHENKKQTPTIEPTYQPTNKQTKKLWVQLPVSDAVKVAQRRQK